jgi:hypothetical protein
LLCTKCPSISKELGLEEGSHILTTLWLLDYHLK